MILPDRGDAALRCLRDQLAAVADSEYGNAETVYLRIRTRSVFIIDTVRPAGKDDPDGVKSAYFRCRRVPGMDFAVNVAFPHTACDQLIVLPSEIHDQDLLLFHFRLPHFAEEYKKRQQCRESPPETPVSFAQYTRTMLACQFLFGELWVIS